jgi:hemolysin activation/secretion protein
VGLDGRCERNDFDNGLLHLEIGSAHTGSIGFRSRIAADVSRHLDRDRQITLGADTGLRGWNPDYFDGTSRVVANVEYRRQLTGEVLHLFVLGATAFVDGGKTWNPRVGPSTQGWRGDIGVGLVAEVTRAAILHVVRLEIAYPDDRSGPVILATGQSLF